METDFEVRESKAKTIELQMFRRIGDQEPTSVRIDSVTFDVEQPAIAEPRYVTPPGGSPQQPGGPIFDVNVYTSAVLSARIIAWVTGGGETVSHTLNVTVLPNGTFTVDIVISEEHEQFG